MSAVETSSQLMVLHPALQNYAWGSPANIPELMGAEPTGEPVAEAWYGAHDAAPSTLDDGTTLASLITRDAAGQLGASNVERFGERLPYLLKLLAAADPLSIQVHPTIEQALEGCAREDAAGIDRAAPNRSFRDDNHKPELICALTRFEAMVGFREIDKTLALFDAIDADELGDVATALRNDGLGAALRLILTLDADAAARVVDAVVAGCAAVTGQWRDQAELLERLAAKYPGDPGVLTASLLNRIVLEPGQAVYLGAGNLHAYVEGFGVEIMANSDNVLRGGLTPKHMDVAALLEVVEAVPYLPPILGGVGDAIDYDTPAPEFALTRLVAPTSVSRQLRGPEIVLCASDSVTVTTADGQVTATAGSAVWVPVAAGHATIDSDGQVFIAAVGE